MSGGFRTRAHPKNTHSTYRPNIAAVGAQPRGARTRTTYTPSGQYEARKRYVVEGSGKN